ncbi:MAG: membrane-bound lytic murein transglycosylase MltF [Bdellovibrionota bacterium]
MSWIRNASKYFGQRISLFGGLGLFVLSTNGCDGFWAASSYDIAEVQSQGSLRVLALEGPLVYRVGKNKETYGIDYDLLQSFANDYKLKIKWLPVKSEQDMNEALARGDADMAVGRLRGSSEQSRPFLVAPAIEDTHLSLFCRKNERIQKIDDLTGKRIIVFEKDLNLYPIENIKSRISNNSESSVKFNVWVNGNIQTAFRELAVKSADCVVAENFEAAFWMETFLTIEKIAPVSEDFSLNWMVNSSKNSLLNLLRSWLVRASRKDEINRVHDRYHLFVRELGESDVRMFLKKSRDTLPAYLRDIKRAAQSHGIPWQLVAAVSYQESKWNPAARSYTGVRGMMQLTEDTAKLMGVDDRRDAKQSIKGGTKYLKYLYEKIPEHLNAKDRLALTLVAYNMGYGHLLDAQKIAISLGKNSTSWKDLKSILPLLTKEKYFSQTSFGYARGYETVQYVERTHSYYHLLVLRD